ncbi:MAG: [acyl-carrier-protein] S-malonyltransferase [Proteobacteria bacterium]|nr:[acyl-carrier-protein] S-malonyltransferase [Pseudomonadota bacterium]
MNFAFVFPGQGSQSVAMLGDDIYVPIVAEKFEEASDVLDKDLIKLVKEGPVEDINKTINTQIIMLTSGVAFWSAWKKMGGVNPKVMAGHSLGEYVALVAGESLTFRNALNLVHIRSTLMQNAVPDGVGGIAAIIGLNPIIVEDICVKASSKDSLVSAANFNSPIQTVIAGHRTAVERAIELASQKGAKRAVMLPMSVPSHCSLLSPMIENFSSALDDAEIRLPAIPILHNASLKVAKTVEEIRKVLVQQVVMPVNWTKLVNIFITEYQTSKIFELGPSKILTGLNKRISKDVENMPIDSLQSMEKNIIKIGD